MLSEVQDARPKIPQKRGITEKKGMVKAMKQYTKRITAFFLALLTVILPLMLSSCQRNGGKEEILVWVAEEIVDFTRTQCDAFLKENPDIMEKYTIKVSPMGGGETATQMLTDVESGADVYAFAQDQLGRLVQAGALAKLGGTYLSDVKANNDEGSVNAVTLGDTIYAYPLTSDNGYFLYYDKRVVKDPSTLDGILADCKAAGKNLYMDNQSGWYGVSFFFGSGCSYTTETNDKGEIKKVNCDFDSDDGVEALRAMVNMAKSGAFQRGDSFASQFNPDGGRAGAAISGTWDAATIKGYLGENYGVAKLPTMTTAEGQEQMSAWAGFKLMGVNPTQSDEAVVVSHKLAAYLTSESAQLARYNEKGWGPSNKNAQQNEAVQKDEALSALREQLAFSPAQPQCSANFWAKMEALGTEVNAGTYNNYTDDQLEQVLIDLTKYLRADVVS